MKVFQSQKSAATLIFCSKLLLQVVIPLHKTIALSTTIAVMVASPDSSLGSNSQLLCDYQTRLTNQPYIPKFTSVTDCEGWHQCLIPLVFPLFTSPKLRFAIIRCDIGECFSSCSISVSYETPLQPRCTLFPHSRALNVG